MLDASRLGVPQTRKRLIVVGLRDGDPEPALPAEGSERAAISAALPGVARIWLPPAPCKAEHYAFRKETSWPATGPGPTVAAGGLGNWRSSLLRIESPDGTERLPTYEDAFALQCFPSGFRLPDRAGPSARWRMAGNASRRRSRRRSAKGSIPAHG